MARATSDRIKSRGRPAAGRSAAVAKTRATGVRAAAKAPTSSAAASKDELRARVEKLERANATLRAKNKELRLVAVESAEQVDALTVRLANTERGLSRQNRHEAPAQAVAHEIVRPARGRRKARAASGDAGHSDSGQSEDGHTNWGAAGLADA